jgi:hypothetical protein
MIILVNNDALPEFISEFNYKFAVQPKSAESAYVPLL